MKILTLLSGLLLFTACSPKADVDAYVKSSCECIEKIGIENQQRTAVANQINNCFDFANNHEVFQELITQYMDENPEAGYVTAEQNAPLVIEAKLKEACPTYKAFTEN